MATSITLRDVAALIRDAIKGNTALATYCTGTLGKALTVQVGSNPQQPLGTADAPFCIVVMRGKNIGDVSSFSWDFDISFGLSDTIFSNYQAKGAVEMRGQYRLEELGDKIMVAVETLEKNYIIANQRTQLDSDAFPLHIGLHSLTLTSLNVIGGTIGLN